MLFDDNNDDLLDDFDESEKSSVAGISRGLLPPREMPDCLGHKNLEDQFLDLYSQGRMPHALILSGPEGIGKATLAFRLARFLLRNENGSSDSQGGGLFGEALPPVKYDTLAVDPADPVFRQVVSGGHPDLLTIERPFDEKKGRKQGTVPVEEVRKITPFLRMTASQGGWRVVIVDDADTMNRNSQNAILKILEEPPRDTLLILVCHRAGAMLPTIRSRCRTISVQPPDQDTFAAIVSREGSALEKRDIETLFAVSNGSPGSAVRMLRDGGLEVVGRIVGLLADWPRWNWPQIHTLADGMARAGQEDSQDVFRDVFQWITETILRSKATGKPLPAILNNEALLRLVKAYDLNEWIGISDALKNHFDTADHASLDKKQAILGAFMMFERKAAA